MAIIENATKEVLESTISSGAITIVDFWTPWCSSCKTLGPVLEKIGADHPEIQVVKINVDENSELSTEYGIRSIPAVFIYKNGEKTNNFVGMKNESEIIKLL